MTRLSAYARDGLVFDVRDEGPEDGDPVVLLHGFPERASSWAKVAPLLHEQGLRTYAPDQRGYSPGARPPRRRDYRLSELTDDVVALIEAIGRPVHLVGHDWGSAVAWSVAGSHADRVRTLTAVSVPHPTAFLKAMTSSRQGLKSWYMGFFQLPWLPERLLSGAAGERFLRQGGMRDEEVARYRDEVVADGALHGGLMWYRGMLTSDPRATAHRVRVPTTLVWSDGDVAIGRTAVDATPPFVLADYRLVVMEGVTHWIPTQEPEALAEAILARVGSV